MRKALTRILALVAALALAAACLGAWFFYRLAHVGTGYKAKVICSAVFVSKRSPAPVLAEDAAADTLQILKLFPVTIDPEERSVTASFLNLVSRTAVYRDGIGATLAIGRTPAQLLQDPSPDIRPPPFEGEKPWPEGELIDLAHAAATPGVDGGKLSQVVTSAFEEPDPESLRRTRAVVVVYGGRIIAENYADGFSAWTPLAGWSMTKSVTNALVGILVGRDQLRLQDDRLLPEWTVDGPGADPRAAITLDHLMRMSSGLAFNENYVDPLDDVVQMLFCSGDTAAYASGKPLRFEPGAHWAYSSGTTNIISRILRNSIGDDAVYHAFPYRELFYRIGMRSAVMERDASGNFVASSFMFATARDWARLGLLFLNDGVWEGERILPEGWVAYTATPAPATPAPVYGAHFWLRTVENRPVDHPAGEFPLPDDTLHMSGHEGQFVTIIPSRKLVVVRLGLSVEFHAWNQEGFVAELLTAFPEE